MKIKIGFFSVMLFLSLLMTHSFFAISAFLAVTLHELGHIAASRLCRVHLSKLSVGLYGARLKADNEMFSYKNEIFICIAGPAVNFISVLIFIPVYKICGGEFLRYFIFSSLILGTLNILPIKTFDGGRILHSLLCLSLSPRAAETFLSIISFFFVFVLWCVSVYLLLVARYGLSMFVFSVSLFNKFFVSSDTKTDQKGVI